MSRSYKHRKGTLVHVKEQNSRFGKRQASAAVRRAVDVPDGRQYRKYYCSWDISDYAWTENKYTRDEFRHYWFDTAYRIPDRHGLDDFEYYRSKFRNWKEAYRFYVKHYKTK